MSSRIINFTLNGRAVEALTQPVTTLQALLRDQLGFTATKSGCRQGGCGSCTVLVNGEPMMSCLLPAEDIEGEAVTTLEGLSSPDGLHPIQQSFYERFAAQCGYCTPGMIIVSKALLDHNPHPSREEIVAALIGNYCRCTGYESILRAVEDAARRMNGREGA
jgi:carbon-monoxide dehydrogenase small subunit